MCSSLVFGAPVLKMVRMSPSFMLLPFLPSFPQSQRSSNVCVPFLSCLFTFGRSVSLQLSNLLRWTSRLQHVLSPCLSLSLKISSMNMECLDDMSSYGGLQGLGFEIGTNEI